ncbi:hypothetical protein GCM10009122_22860 [Fulvivirga kasyanovii]|nr:hypothetical protein [Fulvivirga kasyanovii]
MSDIADEVKNVLSQDFRDIVFEEIADEYQSPLNQPVKEKDIARIEAEKPPLDDQEEAGSYHDDEETAEAPFSLDAPEQEINEEYDDMQFDGAETEEFELPTSHARQVADTFLGIADNVMEVGGGFFIKIKKHKEFYEFDEIIQVIEEQNTRNVKRLRLDDEDKALLRPLLVAILKKKATKLTPEQQLLGAVLSILIKKGQAVMEIRMENEILVERILDIMREERGAGAATQNKDDDLDDEQINEESSKDQIETPVLEVAEDDDNN